MFRRLVSSLSSDHVKVLGILRVHSVKHRGLNIKRYAGFPGMAINDIGLYMKADKNVLPILICELEQGNLITNVLKYDSNGSEASDRYKLTSFGIEFLDSIREGAV